MPECVSTALCIRTVLDTAFPHLTSACFVLCPCFLPVSVPWHILGPPWHYVQPTRPVLTPLHLCPLLLLNCMGHHFHVCFVFPGLYTFTEIIFFPLGISLSFFFPLQSYSFSRQHTPLAPNPSKMQSSLWGLNAISSLSKPWYLYHLSNIVYFMWEFACACVRVYYRLSF